MIGSKSLLHYDVLDKIGEGQLGEVYLAVDNEHSRQVALRVLPPAITANSETMARVEASVRDAAALKHPSIASVHGLFAASDSTFIVTELVTGSPIDAEKGKAIRLQEAIDRGLELAEALSEANDKSIVHGALKPSNVIAISSGRLKLLDFGFPAELHERPRQNVSAVNELPYISPERLSGQEANHGSDIYAAGIVLYRMITGRLPFVMGAATDKIIDQIMHGKPAPMFRQDTDLPTELSRTVGRCLQKDPGRRYETASELAADLTSIKATLQFF